ncbi:MAG: hypothetical protein WCP03_02820, partial [Candidatus Saccharibacteria bacterium]
MNKLQADMPEQGPSKGPAANERLSSAELGIIIANQIEYKRGLDQVGPMPELTKDYISFTKGCYLSLVSELPKDADAVDSQLSVTKSGLLFMEQKSIKIAAYNPEIQNWLIEKEITSYQPDEAQQLSNLIVGTMGFTESVKNNDGSEMSYEQRALAALKYASADLGNKVSAESNILFLETGIVEITKDDELIAIGYDNKALAKIFKDKRSYSLLKEKIKNMQSRMSQDKRSRAGSFTTSLIDQVINDNIEQKFGLESKDNLSDTEALRQHIYNDYGIYVRSEESHKENTYGKIDQLDIALIVNLIQASQPLLNGIKEIEKNVASSAFSDTETTTKTIKSILIDDNMASF